MVRNQVNLITFIWVLSLSPWDTTYRFLGFLHHTIIIRLTLICVIRDFYLGMFDLRLMISSFVVSTIESIPALLCRNNSKLFTLKYKRQISLISYTLFLRWILRSWLIWSIPVCHVHCVINQRVDLLSNLEHSSWHFYCIFFDIFPLSLKLFFRQTKWQ